MAPKSRGSKRIWKSGYLFIILGILLVFLDQLLKNVAVTQLSETPVDWGFVSFVYATNTGASFSMFQGYNNFIIWFSVIVLGFLTYTGEWLAKSRVAYTLLIAGILGNLIDRIVWGHVIDFIDLGWWPVFNVADSCLVVGVALYILGEFKTIKPATKSAKPANPKKRRD